jgi:hypothetical protein
LNESWRIFYTVVISLTDDSIIFSLAEKNHKDICYWFSKSSAHLR